MTGTLHNLPLWSADEVFAATGGRATAPRSAKAGSWQAEGVSIDSRTCAPGDLFIAIAGPNFDGHDYVAAAFERGAAAAVVTHAAAALPADANLVLVGDTGEALDALGRFARARTGARIVAVTGSVGKTSTKEALAHALSAFGPTHATRGNLNNQWGVPLSLARMPKTTRFGVFELGMNHAGELTLLSQLVRPEVAIITTIGTAHLEFFDSVGGIADAKAEIFVGMTRSGTAILNRDNSWFATLAAAAWARGIENVIGFGEHAEAQARLDRYESTLEGSDVGAIIGGRHLRYRLAMRGRHAALNSLAVLAAVDALGVDAGDAAATLATLQAAKGRGQAHAIAGPNGPFVLIDDSYNASPASMRAAFEVLAATPQDGDGRRIAVLGDMLELGPDSERLHVALAATLIEQKIDLVFTAGSHMAALYDALPQGMRGGHAPRSDELLAAVQSRIGSGDIVLVKGSLGSRMALIVDALMASGNDDTQAAGRHAGGIDTNRSGAGRVANAV